MTDATVRFAHTRFSPRERSTRVVRSAALALVATTAVTATAATASGEGPENGQRADPPSGETVVPALGRDRGALEPADVDAAPISASKKAIFAVGGGRQTFLIQLQDDAVPTYTGGLSGLSRTAPRRGQQLNSESVAARAYTDHLVDEQADFVTRMEDIAGRDGTRYFFRVAARNAAGTGAVSTTATATPRN